jgi:hypothetical protein
VIGRRVAWVALTLLGMARPAVAVEDAARGALSIGANALQGGAPELATGGFHLGSEAAFHLGYVGPVLSLDLDRFDNNVTGNPTWLVGMGAGLRGFYYRSPIPVALFADVQGIVAGPSVPISATAGTGPYLGVAVGAGLEWTGPVEVALAVRFHDLSDGPHYLVLSLVLGLGAP